MFKSFLWDFFSKLSNQIISFVVSVFLTRLILPEEFGVMGIALVVIAFSTIFVDLGFGKAIIQQKEINETQLSTVFFLNFIVSVLFSIICFLLSYPAARFFKMPDVEPVLQVLSLSFIFYGLNVVPNALLYRRMNFKITAVVSTISSLISGIVGIYMAKKGYGVWSLVVQNLSAAFLSFLMTFLYLRWLPKLTLILNDVKAMWRYSSRLFISALLDTMFTRLDIVLIGKMFLPATLGYYTRAQSMDGVVKQVSSTSIVSVLFPYLSREQSNTSRVKELYINYLHVISFVSFFISGFLYLSAESIFTILFSQRWIESAYLFKIMTIAGFVYPVSALMVSVLSARGNSVAYLRAELFKKLVITPAYIVGFFLGLHGFVYCLSVAYIMALLVNILFVRKEIYISLIDQLKIILTYGISTLVIVLSILATKYLFEFNNVWFRLMVQASIFVVIFSLFHSIIRTTGFNLVFAKVKSILRK